jgi:PheRS DNA binding domain 3/PheRS DNA binding domain 1
MTRFRLHIDTVCLQKAAAAGGARAPTAAKKEHAVVEGEDGPVDLEQIMLDALSIEPGIIGDSWEFAAGLNVDHQVIVGVVKSLLVDQYVADEPLTTTFWTLTDEGQEIADKGSPEFQVYNAVPAEGIQMTELQAKLPGDVVKIGLGPCMKNKWLKVRICARARARTLLELLEYQGKCSTKL